MFGTIRKHQNWLWFVIITVTCLSMVIYFQPGGKQGSQDSSSGDLGSIDNKTITATEWRDAKNEAALMFFLRSREWPDSAGAGKQFDWDREAYQRLFLLRRLNDFNIHSDPDAAAQVAGMILRQLGNGQQVPLETFVDQILKPRNMTGEDFQHFLEHDISIQQLISVIGASGQLVTPAEIQSLYVNENQELAADAVFFSASNYLAKIQEPTPDVLGQFYTNQMANYREPDQMQASYVFFNVTNFMPEAEKQIGTNLNRITDEEMTQFGTNTSRFGKTTDEARAKIRELIIQETAISNANAKASAFENEAMNKEPLRAENLNAVAREKGFEVKVTKPFEKEYGPGDLNLGSSFPVASLFNLTPEEQPFVDRPVRGLDGMYVLAFNKLIPSRILPLDEIRNRVVTDYKFVEAMRLAQMNGHVFSQTATNELAHGKTFAATCAATGVKPVEVPPFSLSSQRMPEVEDHAEVGTFKEVALSTPIGTASSFVPTRDGGYVVYVKQRLPIDETKMKTQLADFSKAVRQRRENEAFELWFNQEASKALRDIPAFRRPSTAAR